MDKRKMANNILEFLIDPTVIPVQTRVYFRPEEQLDNRSYEKAKSESFLAYRSQRNNSDMYPTRNRKLTRMGGFSMDRKTMIASLDILSKKFASVNDPIATDLRTMAKCFSEMTDEEISARLAEEEAVEPVKEKAVEPVKKKAVEPVKEKAVEPVKEEADKTASGWMDAMAKARKENPKKEGEPVKKWFKRVTDAAHLLYKKEASESEMAQAMEMLAAEEALKDNWGKEASNAVAKALVSDVLGKDLTEEEADKKPGIPDGTGPMKDSPACPFKKEEKPAEAKPEKKSAEANPEEKPVEAKIAAKVEEKVEADKAAEVDTAMLAKEQFAGIELTNGMISAEDIGDLSTEEISRLDLLFQK